MENVPNLDTVEITGLDRAGINVRSLAYPRQNPIIWSLRYQGFLERYTLVLVYVHLLVPSLLSESHSLAMRTNSAGHFLC